MFVLSVVETVENDENHSGETEDRGGAHQEQDQLPQQERERGELRILRSFSLTCPSFVFSSHLKS